MAESADRRAAERYPVNAEAICPFVSPVVENFGQARIKDISMQGVGLLMSRRVEPGTLLTITLVNAAHNFTRTVLVRVAHTTSQAGGSYLVGGTFTVPLTYQEMSTLVL